MDSRTPSPVKEKIQRKNIRMKYKSISDLKDKYKGEDIWVIMAGASMDYVEPSFFDGKVTIGLNQVYKRYRCNYVVMKDCEEGPRYPRSIKELQKDGIPLIFSKGYKGQDAHGNQPNHKDAYRFNHNKPHKNPYEEQLNALEPDEIFVSKSTVSSGLHIAAYLGAKNIMICGHDCGEIDGKRYFEDYMEKDWKSSDNWDAIKKGQWLPKIEPITITVREWLKEKYGCNIYSLNPFINFGLEGHEYNGLEDLEKDNKDGKK